MDEKNNPVDPTPEGSPELTIIAGSGEDKPRRGRRPVKPLAKPIYRVLSESDFGFPVVDGDALSAEDADSLPAGDSREAEDVSAVESAPLIDIPKPPVPMSDKKLPKKSLLVALACVVLGLLVYQGRHSIVKAVSPKLYLGMAAGRTTMGFEKELQTFKKNNPVVKQYDSIIGKPSSHVVTFESPSMGFGSLDLSLDIQNDNQKKQLKVGSTVPAVGDVAFYLSDKMGIVSVMGEHYAFDPKAAGKEFTAFFDSNGIDYDEEAIPSDLDISYSTLEKLLKEGRVSGVSSKYQNLSERYGKEIVKLLAAGQYKNEPREEISLGDKSVKAKAVSITLKEDVMVDWLSDLADAMEEDEQLQAFMSIFDNYMYNELCYGIREASMYYTGDVTATVLTVQDRIVVVKVNYKDANRQSYVVELGAVGEKYRLDSLYANAKGMGDNMGIRITGNHIGKGVFSSRISVKNRDTNTIQIKWDPEKAKNNLTVSVMNMVGFRATAAADGDKVVIKPGDADDGLSSLFLGAGSFSYTAQPLKDNIVWPKSTEKLEDLYIGMLFGIVPYY